MASTFKNSVTGRIGTESRRVYIAPGSTTTTVIGLSLANISTSGVEANVFMKVNTSFQAHMVKNAPIPVGGALVVIGVDQKVVAEAVPVAYTILVFALVRAIYSPLMFVQVLKL